MLETRNKDNHGPATSCPTSIEQLTAQLKAAGDQLRLEILRVLARDSFAVLELCHIFAIKQSSMSHHLKLLTSAGLIAARREGNSIFYRRATPAPDQALTPLQQQLFRTLDSTALGAGIATRVAQIQHERAQTSQQFFAENSAKFREQQDMIASYPVYAEHVSELLANTPLPATQCVLEVGPGEGEFLALLAPKFRRVIALDNADEMLNRAQTLARQQQLNNIEFIHGDTQLAVQRGLNADCVVANMVLHHTPSPAEVIADLSQLLKPGGALLVTDLCRHDQNWAREACGDLWQGFEPEELGEWAHTAGLQVGSQVIFALRNGFQIQIRQFFKAADTAATH